MFALLVAHLGTALLVHAQSAPRVRPIGPLIAVSSEQLTSISQTRALPGGRVLLYDIRAQRVVMFDSTLKHMTVVVESTPELGALIRYHGDTTLSANLAQVSLAVIDPAGRIVRTMAIPDPRNMLGFIGGPYGSPGFDARDRLVYAAMPPRPTVQPPVALADTAPIIRFDLATRGRDTVAMLHVPPARFAPRTIRAGKDTSTMLWRALDPTPTTDDWAVLSDGTIAVVRGQDYHVDMINANGAVTAGPKIPFTWQRLSTEDKSAIIDSTRNAMAAREAAALAARAAALAKADSTALGGQRRVADRIGIIVTFPLVTIDEMPDYRPAFEQGASRADVDGNLWVRTSKFVDGGAVYDVIDRRGVLVDRVSVPQGRIIAGFGPGGLVYMGVLVGERAQLEVARVR
jgi:hypothetical protein